MNPIHKVTFFNDADDSQISYDISTHRDVTNDEGDASRLIQKWAKDHLPKDLDYDFVTSVIRDPEDEKSWVAHVYKDISRTTIERVGYIVMT